MKTLPHVLPSAYKRLAGQPPATSDIDTGGYDVLISGLGFRLATDTQFPYLRQTEPTTVRRFDSSQEPGEQSLSPLPWIKSQSSFHAGAGQQNLEAPFTAFQYQQEQIAHLRYDTSLGVDPWTPGKVVRLPDTTFTNYGFSVKDVVTATVGGIDYAIVGGVGSLVQIAWNSGPDIAPTVTTIDLSSATYGGASNISVTSLTTDGKSYFGVMNLTAPGSTPGVLTYIISGSVASTASPTALYEVPRFNTAPIRTNLFPNPSVTSATTGYSPLGTGSVAVSSTHAFSGTTSCQATLSTWAGGDGVFINSGSVVLVPGKVYTASVYVYVPTGTPDVQMQLSGVSGSPFPTPAMSTKNAWVRISMTFTASGVGVGISIMTTTASTAGQLFWVDAVLIEQTGTLGTYFDGSLGSDSTYVYSWTGTANASTSQAQPLNVAVTSPGVVGWVKERLIAGLANFVFELPTGMTTDHNALPVAKYTHPVTSWLWTAVSDSPVAILISGGVGGTSSITKFALDTSGATPTLSGGATIAVMPLGEQIYSMASYLGSYIALGTNKGLRVGTFDTYTGALTYGPISLTTTSPVYGVAGRDRFVFAGYTNQQADGKTGLARIDLSQPIDTANRLAWAPDLRPPSSAPTGLGTVWGVAVLPFSARLMFITSEGIHVEGNGPGTDGAAWIRTSRIRYDTDEMKLFKLGRIHGTLDTSTIGITGITQFGGATNLGTFGFISGSSDPGEFGLPTGLQPWIQLQFQLNGASCVLNSYQAKAIPAPSRQRVITMTVNCFREEVDKFGLSVTDPVMPRQRYEALKALESSGNEIRLVEFTVTGSVATLVVIDQLEYHSFSRPTILDDFGGYLTIKMRETTGS